MDKKLKIAIGAILLMAVIYVVYIIIKKRKEKKAIEALNAALAVKSTGTAPSSPAANDNFPLQIGSKGTRVKYLQDAINRINKNSSLVADGDLGTKTRDAIYLTLSTAHYPVTIEKYNEILSKAVNTK